MDNYLSLYEKINKKINISLENLNTFKKMQFKLIYLETEKKIDSVSYIYTKILLLKCNEWLKKDSFDLTNI